jgi:hypothetical protein
MQRMMKALVFLSSWRGELVGLITRRISLAEAVNAFEFYDRGEWTRSWSNLSGIGGAGDQAARRGDAGIRSSRSGRTMSPER